jgi:hypothetical protein
LVIGPSDVEAVGGCSVVVCLSKPSAAAVACTRVLPQPGERSMASANAVRRIGHLLEIGYALSRSQDDFTATDDGDESATVTGLS